MAKESTRVKELFHEALERPAEERAAFLDASCGDDLDLRTKVYTLLQALKGAESFLVEGKTPSAKLGEQPGATIDRYKLLQEIGEGGFGVVWMAEQTEPVRRRVALKVIKVGMDTKQVVARFEAERQALAMMDHPNIARVLDAGATSAGRPYFVMELVRGVPITTYCDQTRLNTRERIELFLRVCHAAQHAHQKGVIHRDLKPNNILVTLQDGVAVPKVIDFGIAKATAQELTQKTLFTELKQIVGTPEYMSPEQAEMSGLDVDTRTDVYSLGVTLYELLTGKRPFELREDLGFLELLRQVVEVEPSRPSTRLNTLGDQLPELARQRHTEPHRLQRLLRGDLDCVVMKALAKNRSQRYPTANALMEDLQRYLDDLPVEAGPPSALYRGFKFCHRHRFAVGAAIAFAALLVVTAAISTGFAVEAVQARNEAEQQTDLTLQQSYIANIYAAEAALRNQDTTSAALHLASTAEDLRGWEWHYLNSRADLSLWTANPPETKATAMAFHPDESVGVIASSWEDGGLRLYDTERGRLLKEARHDEGPVRSLAFSVDGASLYAGDDEGGITVLDWTEGGEEALAGHEGRVTALGVSPDGSTLASASRDKTLKLWDTQTHELKRTLAHAAEVRLVAWSPDGKTLAATSWDQTFTLWDAVTGEMISRQPAALPSTEIEAPIRWAPGNVETIAFDPSSRWLATGCRDGSVAVWDARSGSLVFQEGAHDDLIRDVAWSPNGARLAAASLDRTISLWDTASWTRIETLLGHSDDVRSIAFHPNGEVFATISWDRSVKLWRTGDGQLRGTMLGHGEGIYAVEFSPDGKYLSTFAEDGTLRTWETLVGFMESIHAQAEGGWVYSVAFAMHNLLATSDMLGPVRIWDLTTGRERLNNPISHEPGIYSLALHPRGFTLATSSSNRNGEADYGIRLWDLRFATILRTLSGHEGTVRNVIFSDDGELLASSSDDATVRIWDPETGVEKLRLEGHDGPVREVAFASGQRVVSGSEDGTVRVWNSTTGGLLQRIVNDSQIHSLAVHPDSSIVALGCGNRMIFLHDLETGELLASLQGHGGPVTSLAWLPDGTRLVSGSVDRTVRLWDPVIGENVATLQGHTRQVRIVAVSSDGRRIASGGEDNVVRLWNLRDR